MILSESLCFNSSIKIGNAANNNVIDSTYEVLVNSEVSIIKEHVKFQAGLGITVKDDYKHLPKHYFGHLRCINRLYQSVL